MKYKTTQPTAVKNTSTKPVSQEDSVVPPEAVLLFCRLPGEPYVNLGRLVLEKSELEEKPMRFLWRLQDLHVVQQSEKGQEMLTVAGST